MSCRSVFLEKPASPWCLETYGRSLMSQRLLPVGGGDVDLTGVGVAAAGGQSTGNAASTTSFTFMTPSVL